MIPNIEQCWFLSGPTASGKTSIGLELAEMIDAEIISMDSMAIYREMDISTAKPTLTQRDRVRHHMIDVVDPDVETLSHQHFETSLQNKLFELSTLSSPRWLTYSIHTLHHAVTVVECYGESTRWC